MSQRTATRNEAAAACTRLLHELILGGAVGDAWPSFVIPANAGMTSVLLADHKVSVKGQA